MGRRNAGSVTPRALTVLAPGLAIPLLFASCATAPKQPPRPPDIVVLLPDDQGKTGSIIVSGAKGERVLSKPFEAVKVEAGSMPGEPFTMQEKDVRAQVAPALSALPPPPLQFILYFNHDTADLTPESQAKVNEVTRTIKERSPVDISVVGHTDTVGSKEHNYALSLRRARAVAALLVAHGVDPSLIDTASHGEDNPLIPTSDEVPEPRNRRVEVTVR
ncbi:MAG: OmpA family protein [Deltaproteobacteria bacterium]|nr:OmpA family protein [Deltaproteobacteria bacterium]